MEIKILKECGYEEALLGIGLSYNVADTVTELELPAKLHQISCSLYNKEGGHNKFLESMIIWLDITAPRYLFAEIDTYRVGTSKQSESTMHTLLRKPFSQEMFQSPIPEIFIEELERVRIEKDFITLKNLLPEGFLQRRIWCLNYKVLRNIIFQRKNHRLTEWKIFCDYMINNVQHKEYFDDLKYK